MPAALLAIPLYQYSIFDMGLSLVAFLIVLMAMGWALGLAICGGILRHGMGAESLAWTVIFAIAPLSCVYYPVTTLPGWLEWFVGVNPISHLVSAARGLMQGLPLGRTVQNSLLWTLGIVVVFAPMAVLAYRRRT